jgi:galactokinase
MQILGRLCERAFAGARDLLEITIPEMESMFSAMTRAPGVVGARQAGAGFGGCMLSSSSRLSKP